MKTIDERNGKEFCEKYNKAQRQAEIIENITTALLIGIIVGTSVVGVLCMFFH